MASTTPIIRSTPDQRLANFNANSTSIYNKYSPYTSYSIGPSQPFIYTKISDSNISRNLTKYDSQALPIGSTARDLKRIGQYMITGNGLLYTSKQLLLQNTNAFNETRIYNPLSLLKATAKPGSTGLIDYPQRHLETSGGILNFFKDALLSTIGMQSKNLAEISSRPIDGTATGVGGVAYSAYAGARGGARAGMLRYNTGIKASTKFDEVWVSSTSDKRNSRGFLASIGNALLNKLKSLIPSTNPLGAFGGTTNTWVYRPEYRKGFGPYDAFRADNTGLLTGKKSIYFTKFHNQTISNIPAIEAAKDRDTPVRVGQYHRYYPVPGADDRSEWYASPDKIKIEGLTSDPSTGGIGALQGTTGLKNVYAEYMKTIESFDINKPIQSRRSIEAYSKKDASYSTYEDIPGKGGVGSTFTNKLGASVTIEEKNLFAKSSGSKDGEDRYNVLPVLPGSRGEEPRELTQGRFGELKDQSRDLIFFYFFDLINKKYIPFRATISSLSDQHSADWEDINYLGRADKLFLYKGFSRDVSFSFTVYANSAKEMLPMWNRINYLVGLTKPSKYTGKAEITRDTTNEDTVRTTFADAIQAASGRGDQNAVGSLTNGLSVFESGLIASGKESKFIYPPMITLRLGDLFYDQPCVISSVGVNVPDDTNWESLRSDDYSYRSSPTNRIKISGTKSRQLPMKVDVQVQLKLMEKRQALGSDGHYGNSDGTNWKL